MTTKAPRCWLNDTMRAATGAEAEAGWAAQQRFLADVFGGFYETKSVRWRFACDSGHDYVSQNVRLE